MEKNVCDSVIKFLLGVKDIIKVHHDMEVCGVRPHLWLMQNLQRFNKIFKPKAPYVLKQKNLKVFFNKLAYVKVLTDYCGVAAKHIANKKLVSMKSHN
jgi:hypothetical protein